jgi:hypothetical protein
MSRTNGLSGCWRRHFTPMKRLARTRSQNERSAGVIFCLDSRACSYTLGREIRDASFSPCGPPSFESESFAMPDAPHLACRQVAKPGRMTSQ